MFTLIFLSLCRARPLSVSLFSMTPCPPSMSFPAFSLATLYSPFSYQPAFLYSLALLLLSTFLSLLILAWHCRQASRSLPGARPLPPSLPQVSVCGPQAAPVSGGLSGRRSLIRLPPPPQQSGFPAG